MNKEQTKKAIEVMQAFVDGKTIQFRPINRVEWSELELHSSIIWNWHNIDYRIKPEPNVRPYKDREECWNDMQKHQPFGWIKIKDSGNYEFLDIIAKDSDFEFIFKNHTYVDGSPFGIVEE